jgi:hypothetical protein
VYCTASLIEQAECTMQALVRDSVDISIWHCDFTGCELHQSIDIFEARHVPSTFGFHLWYFLAVLHGISNNGTTTAPQEHTSYTMMNSHTSLQTLIRDYEQQQQRKQDEDALRLSDANADHTELDSLEIPAETDIDTDVEEDDEAIEPVPTSTKENQYNACDDVSQLWTL